MLNGVIERISVAFEDGIARLGTEAAHDGQHDAESAKRPNEADPLEGYGSRTQSAQGVVRVGLSLQTPCEGIAGETRYRV